MHTPGYEVEMLTKPAITAKIEEGDTPVTPANAAKALLKGEFLFCLKHPLYS
jgi:3-dehydrosphinganine reductase